MKIDYRLKIKKLGYWFGMMDFYDDRLENLVTFKLYLKFY